MSGRSFPAQSTLSMFESSFAVRCKEARYLCGRCTPCTLTGGRTPMAPAATSPINSEARPSAPRSDSREVDGRRGTARSPGATRARREAEKLAHNCRASCAMGGHLGQHAATARTLVGVRLKAAAAVERIPAHRRYRSCRSSGGHGRSRGRRGRRARRRGACVRCMHERRVKSWTHRVTPRLSPRGGAMPVAQPNSTRARQRTRDGSEVHTVRVATERPEFYGSTSAQKCAKNHHFSSCLNDLHRSRKGKNAQRTAGGAENLCGGP